MELNNRELDILIVALRSFREEVEDKNWPSTEKLLADVDDLATKVAEAYHGSN